MNKLKPLFLIASLFVITSCGSKKIGDFKVLPQPQKFEITAASSLDHTSLTSAFSPKKDALPILSQVFENLKTVDNEADAQVIYSIDTSLNIQPEGYTMDISEHQVNIIAKDPSGLFYAFKTLEQLLTDAYDQKVTLPVCHIEDYPLLSYRSVHLDMKHHVEQLNYYYNLIDKLALYKVNGIIAEIEDKLQYSRQPEVASADALSKEEFQKLSSYAKERHIEISPLVQGLGHASFILKHEKYKELRDEPESDWAFNPLNPKTFEVQFDLYKDAMEALPDGKYLHIGGDEVHTTGRNSGKSTLELQLIWLNKVCQFAEENGRTPIFWDDMPLKDAGVYGSMFDNSLSQPEVDSVWQENEHKLLAFLDKFPKNCIYMRWNYSNSDALGNATAMKWFLDHDLQVMGATAGQTRWVLMPQEESNMNNIRSFVKSSIDNKLDKLFLTLWEDDSPHFELYMRGILAFAEYSWSGDKRTKDEIKAAHRQREFSSELASSEYGFIDDLEVQVAFWKNALLKGDKRNYLKKMEDALTEGVVELPYLNNKGAWVLENKERLAKAKTAYESYKKTAGIIAKMKTKANRNVYTLEVYEQVNEMVGFASNALLSLEKLDNAKTEEETETAIKNIKSLSKEFQEKRNKLEAVYSKTRILNKPANYILDQDYHSHLANQSVNFDWQFYAEMLFLEKVAKTYE